MKGPTVIGILLGMIAFGVFYVYDTEDFNQRNKQIWSTKGKCSIVLRPAETVTIDQGGTKENYFDPHHYWPSNQDMKWCIPIKEYLELKRKAEKCGEEEG